MESPLRSGRTGELDGYKPSQVPTLQCWKQPPTHLQSESIFFGKVPPEIRLLIYEKLFGYRTLHFFQIYSRLATLEQEETWGKLWGHSVCSRDRRSRILADVCLMGGRKACEKL